MKLYNIFSRLSLFVISALALASCYDITDTHKEWLDKGEKIYVGKIDSLAVRSGMNRAEIVGNARFLRTAVKCDVTFNGQTESYKISDITKEDGTVSIMLDNLDRGQYYFYVQTFDKDGNASILSEVFGSVYGEEDPLLELPRRIRSMNERFDGRLEILWNDIKTEYYVLQYEDADGVMQTLTLEDDPEKTVIDSWKHNGKMTVNSFVYKNATDLDIFALPAVNYTMPAELTKAIPRFGANSKMTLGYIKDWGITDEFTMEVMARYTEFASGDQCLISWEHSPGGMMLRSSTDRLQFYISDAAYGWRLAGQTAIKLNEWYHIAITFKANDNIELYVNGNLIGRNSCTTIRTDNTGIFQLGTSPQYPARYMRGDIQHFSVWEDVRTADEIKSDMALEFTGEEEGLLAYWPLDVNFGTEFPDKTGRWTATFSNVIWYNVAE